MEDAWVVKEENELQVWEEVGELQEEGGFVALEGDEMLVEVELKAKEAFVAVVGDEMLA